MLSDNIGVGFEATAQSLQAKTHIENVLDASELGKLRVDLALVYH